MALLLLLLFLLLPHLHGACEYTTPATTEPPPNYHHHQPPLLHLCAIVLLGRPPLRERTPRERESTDESRKNEYKNRALGARPSSPSTSGVCVASRIYHRFSTPFERLAGGHLVQGTSSLLLIACIQHPPYATTCYYHSRRKSARLFFLTSRLPLSFLFFLALFAVLRSR